MWRVDPDHGGWVRDLPDGSIEPLTGPVYTCDADFAPRAQLPRPRISIEVTPSELHRLVKALEAEALKAIEDGRDDYGDYLLVRCAELRDASR